MSTAPELFAAAAAISYPEGYFIRTLSEAQLASIWGQETLWLTDAENEVTYDGSGIPWIVRLTGTDGQTARSRPSFRRSSCRPPVWPSLRRRRARSTVSPWQRPQGRPTPVVSFVRGEGADAVGMRITMEGELPPLQELAARLVTQSLERTACCSCHQLETGGHSRLAQ